jgi:hypothetical protein
MTNDRNVRATAEMNVFLNAIDGMGHLSPDFLLSSAIVKNNASDTVQEKPMLIINKTNRVIDHGLKKRKLVSTSQKVCPDSFPTSLAKAKVVTQKMTATVENAIREIISFISSSVISSPKSLATVFRSSNEINLSPSASNKSNAFFNSYTESFSLIFVIIISKNSWKSILPLLSLSKLPIKFLISSFVGVNPRALSATLSSFDSIVPDPLVSNKSNAYLISYF